MFNKSLSIRYYLATFKELTIVVLKKPRKLTYKKLKLYRLITLLNTLSKIIDIIIAL